MYLFRRIRTFVRMPLAVLRVREKYVFLVIFGTFIVFCIGGLFFLPELKSGTQFAYRQIKDAGPDLLGFIPPVEEGYGPGVKQPAPLTARAKLSDMQKLADKIRQEMLNINLTQHGAVLPRPYPVDVSRDESSEKKSLVGDNWEPLKLPKTVSDKNMTERRNKVKEIMKHAWDNYVKYAWGDNELDPIRRRGHYSGIFGAGTRIGATIVDAMDTLFIMGMKQEFNDGRDWIADRLSLDRVNSEVSVFEMNIRFVGGLLTCYALTKDKLFLDKAEHIARKLLPAFNTPTGIPYSLINIGTGVARNYAWASSSDSILSEVGTIHLEFMYLSYLTKNPIYAEKVLKIRKVLKEMDKPDGLYPNYINPKTKKWGQRHISIGALGDSFYEYLLKAWIQSDEQDIVGREMYDEAMDAISKHLLQRSPGGLLYLGDMQYGRVVNKMQHLTCFAGGLYALGAKTFNESEREKFYKIGADLTATCRESYRKTATGLGPERFGFGEDGEAIARKENEKYYIQRPETVESYFYLWRLTKDPKYRDWAWDVVLALDKYCKVPHGFTGLKNVYVKDPVIRDNVQQTFFFAETLKYLYLIFSDDDLISLDQWVFNTEGHPLPVLNKHPAYFSPRSDTGDLELGGHRRSQPGYVLRG